jgi:hypothetical protein
MMFHCSQEVQTYKMLGEFRFTHSKSMLSFWMIDSKIAWQLGFALLSDHSVFQNIPEQYVSRFFGLLHKTYRSLYFVFADEREEIQKKTFTKWINSQLSKVGVNIAKTGQSATSKPHHMLIFMS